MTAFAIRAGVLAAVVAVGFLVAWLFARRNPNVESAGLARGITVITGPDCRLCDPAVAALRKAGAEVIVVDDEELRVRLRVRSLPTAVVVDREGSIVARRSGRAVIDDAPTLAAMASADKVR